jgi:indole-3-glycerol phosphate synthase
MATKRRSLEGQLRPVNDRDLARFTELNPQSNRLIQVLKKDEQLAVIAEIKRKSPSAGQIAASSLNAVDQARDYVNAGADCLSILTDTEYFGGQLSDLWEVTDFLKSHQRQTPCLRKDFMLHPIQVLEAAEAGASAILIIVRALDDASIQALYDAANLAGLDSIFEIHEERELEKALRFDPQIIGVNNRDLKRFKTDLAISEALIPQIPENITAISESGIFNVEDAERARACGADALLVGEALMRSQDTEALIADFHRV